MSKADKIFINMCRDILENGTSTEGAEVRPHWPDGTPAYTIKKFGVVNRYDLREEFPAVTLRKTFIKSAMDELLWIWQRKSNNVHELKSHVWDEWADADGSIGAAYGYQLRKYNRVSGITEEGLKKAFSPMEQCIIDSSSWEDIFYLPEGTITEVDRLDSAGREGEAMGLLYSVAYAVCQKEKEDEEKTWSMDQVNKVIYDLKNTPFSRRILTTIWNPADLTEMNLEPCAYSMTFNVTQAKDSDQLVLNSILNQRSQDILAANAWNIAQYALLTMMLAQVCGMQAGEFVHVIADAHIYDRHIPLVKELIARDPKPAPKVWLNPDVKDFYKFTTDDLHIEDYEVGGPQIKDIPIAI